MSFVNAYRPPTVPGVRTGTCKLCGTAIKSTDGRGWINADGPYYSGCDTTTGEVTGHMPTTPDLDRAVDAFLATLPDGLL